jgi:hypothetical protein
MDKAPIEHYNKQRLLQILKIREKEINSILSDIFIPADTESQP